MKEEKFIEMLNEHYNEVLNLLKVGLPKKYSCLINATIEKSCI